MYTGFGKPLKWRTPRYDSRTTHPFFDIPNVLLITGSEAAMTADAITTQRFLAHGLTEENPFVRPLVKYGWSGQLSLQALETGSDILGMYGLHRINHSWIERAIPVGVATIHAVFVQEYAVEIPAVAHPIAPQNRQFEGRISTIRPSAA